MESAPEPKQRPESESSGEGESESEREGGKDVEEVKQRGELKGAAKRIADRKEEAERESRTVFVGNLPLNTKQKHLCSFFKDCGEVEAARFRSIPTVESKLPKRASVALKQVERSPDGSIRKRRTR